MSKIDKMTARKLNYGKLAVNLILLNASSAVVAVIFSASSSGLKRVFSAENLVSTFVFANCIGTLICSAILFLDNFWNRSSTIIRLAKVSLVISVATFLGVTSARFLLSLIFPSYIASGIIPSWQNFIFSLGMGFTFGFAFYFYDLSQSRLAETQEELRRKELAGEKAKTLAREAQIASLESRIHPHFLFNTLNSIASLIREDPVLAEKMVEKLSALLRYSLDSNVKNLVTLKQELEIIEKYLEIERVRFDQRLQYRIEADEKLSGFKLPPLALQTLVENSVKHVASKSSRKTEIVISVKENETGMIIEVSDNGPGFDQNSIQDGHGLDILQKRLAAIFQSGAEMEIIERGTVRLKVPK